MPSGKNPIGFLAPNITLDGWGVGSSERAVTHWEVVLGKNRLFRVRGFGWFKRTIEPSLSSVVTAIPAMETELRQRPGWVGLDGFDWDEPFAARQVYDAAGAKLLQFPKAAKVLLLCELAALDKGTTPEAFHLQMRIEPAVFGITDFDRDFLQAAERERDDILTLLRRETEQESHAVFRDMADGERVSYRLATLTRSALAKAVPKLRVGDVLIRQNGRLPASTNEKIEGDSIPTIA